MRLRFKYMEKGEKTLLPSPPAPSPLVGSALHPVFFIQMEWFIFTSLEE